MRLDFTFRAHLRPRHVLAPVLVAGTLALTACGGSSSNATGTSVASSGTGAAATVTATATEATSMATSTATSAATATSATGTSTSASTSTSTTSTATVAATQAAPTATQAAAATEAATQAPTTASSSATGVPISAVPVMQDVADAWKQVTSYKMEMTIYDSSSNTKTGSATVETMKDKSHWILDQDGQNVEIITIGTDYYLKIAGQWTKMTSDASTTLPPFTSQDILNDVSAPATSPDSVTNKGTDTVNGVTCDVYEIKTDTSTSTLWVGHNDRLIYKGSFDDSGTRTEILFSEFNQQFDIQPPI